MIEFIIQVLIAVMSGGAIWLVTRNNKLSKYGHVLGLAAQPLWLYTSISNYQWGLVILTLFYSYCWATGIYNCWFNKEPKQN